MKNRTPLFAAVAALVLAPLSGTGGPVNYAEVSADADWGLHLDMEALMASPAASLIREKMTEQQAAQLRTFARLFGFDPLEDVNDVTLWGSADIPDKGLLILDGSLDQQVLTDLIRSAEGFKEYRVDGETIYTWIDEDSDERNWGAFHGERHVLVSDDEDYVVEGLAVLNGKSESLTDFELDGELTNPWVLAYADLVSLPKDPENPAFNEAEEAFIEIGTKGSDLVGRLELTMGSEESAANLEKVATGLLAFLQMTADEDPSTKFLVQHVRIVLKDRSLAASIDAPLDETVSALLKHVEE